ncbi:MAG: enoyl-CoA hydratase/isomerase family protein [Betaproteobacteria bacterium]|nr:enoyl-CoA hydratase/isomerase family protein [Betaproteobacteria bacterium]
MEDGVAVICIDHPPVNALSQAVRAGLLAALGQAQADPSVRAVVLHCAGRTFIAGADVTEMNLPPQPPLLPEVTLAIENSPKPVVAALHGTALGGGFEVALAAHWRIAEAGAKVGLPEVLLGLLPGAGGTQRLPRLVGIARALEMITAGKPIDATAALEAGAVDQVEHGGPEALRTAAIVAARRLAEGTLPVRRTGQLPVTPVEESVFENARVNAAKARHPLPAPVQCIAAVEAAQRLPLQEGLQRERELFVALRASPQSAALRHVFLAEREVAKVPGLPADTPTRDVHRVAVIGAGTMGSGIAMCFANAGIEVALLDADAAGLARGMQTIRRLYAASVARGSLAEDEAARRIARIAPAAPPGEEAALGQADLLIEAAFEDIDVKRSVFQRMEACAKPGAILATNTSYLDIARIASFTKRPQDVVGMHFFSPAHVMRLLENVRTRETADDVLATVMKLGRTLGKVAVMVGGADGFVGNRMLATRTREAFFLLEEGALPAKVDHALVEFGFPMGPFAMADLAGLDIGWRNRKARAHLRRPGVRDCDLLDQVCALGRFGQKSGAGWYRYGADGRTPLPDPLITQLIEAHSKTAGIERRAIPDEDIVERCLLAMINEGARILGEGVASRASDIDMVWVHGYGFPAWRGGPMYYANQLGVPQVLARIRALEARFGADFWTPAPLLESLAQSGAGFYPAA